MADGSNLKAKIGMDTGDFEKGAKKVTKAAQSMGKEIGSSLGEVGRALGIDTGLVGDLAKNIENATTLFKGMGAAGGQAASSLTRAMTGLGGAIAGLGLTAAIVAFRELNAMADSFRSTIAGANLELQAQTYRDTFRASMSERLGTGSTVAGLANDAKDMGAKWGGALVAGAVNVIKGAFQNSSTGVAAGIFATADAYSAASDAAAAAAQYQGQINYLLDQQAAKRAEWMQAENEITELEKTARDTQISKAEREAAYVAVVQKSRALTAEQIGLQQEILKYIHLRNQEAPFPDKDVQQERAASEAIVSLKTQQEQKEKSLLRIRDSLAKAGEKSAKAAKEETEATILTLEAATKLVQLQRAQKAIDDQNAKTIALARFNLDKDFWSMPELSLSGLPTEAQGLTASVLVKPELDTEAAEAVVIKWSEIIEQGLTGASEALGTLIGNLINGENAWGNFAKAGIDVVADMLSTVGKAFMATGSGVIAAESALSSGNGYAALAAGAAMVALAATMKTVMSNAAANWGGGYSTSVASSAYTSGAYGPSAFGREMNVKVTGTLTANGSQLVAVLNNENDRKNYTT